jgi:hypothetical protein
MPYKMIVRKTKSGKNEEAECECGWEAYLPPDMKARILLAHMKTHKGKK